MKVQAVLFDYDGTLADTLGLSIRAFQTVFERYNRARLPHEEIIAMFGPTEEEIVRVGLLEPAAAAQAIEDYYQVYEEGHRAGISADSEIARMLQELRSKGIRLGVVTGKSRRAFEISSQALGLPDVWDAVVTGDDVDRPKPDPEGIHRALRLLDVPKEHALFLGDSAADIEAGRRAGIRTFAVQWMNVSQSALFGEPPERIFTKVGEFKAWLEENANYEPKWLDWAKQIQAIAQSGLTYARDVYDLERYEALRRLSVDILHQYTGVGKERIRLTFASETGYATPKVDVRAVVFQENRILLVREKSDGAWALPGGWADIGYSPAEVAVKEIREESGFDAAPVRLLAVLDKKFHGHPPEPYHIYKIFYECRITGGEAGGGVETSEVGFFEEDALPELSLERNTEAQIRMMFEWLRHPEKPALGD